MLVSVDSEQELNEKTNPAQTGTQYKAIDGQSPAWTGVLSSPAGEWTLTYDSLLDPDPSVPQTTGLKPRVAVLVKFVHHDMPELERWYEQEHLQMLRATPGWIRSWRFKREDDDTVVLALHEYASERSFESEELEAARSSKWTRRIVAAAEVMERRVFEVWKKQ